MDELKRALQVLAGIAVGGDAKAQLIGNYLLLINELVQEGQEYRAELRELTAEVEAMALEDRDPTDGEIAALDARSASARNRIAAAKAALQSHEDGDDEDEDDES